MYNLEKRAYFTNLGELRMLLADKPDETEVCIFGQLGSWLHFSKEGNLVCLDSESLYDDYIEDEVGDPDDLSELEEVAEIKQKHEHFQRIHAEMPDYTKGNNSMTSDYYDLIIDTWNHTSEETKADNNYSIRQYVESGWFVAEAFDNWYHELCGELYLYDVRNELDYLGNAIRTFSQLFSDWQYYENEVVDPDELIKPEVLAEFRQRYEHDQRQVTNHA